MTDHVWKKGDKARLLPESETVVYGLRTARNFPAPYLVREMANGRLYFDVDDPGYREYGYLIEHCELVPATRSELEAAIAECELALTAARKALDEFENRPPKVGDEYEHKHTKVYNGEVMFTNSIWVVLARGDFMYPVAWSLKDLEERFTRVS